MEEELVKPTRMGMTATGRSKRAWNDDVASNSLFALLPGRPRKRTRSLLPAVRLICVAESSTTDEKPPTSTYSRTDVLLPSKSNPVMTKFCRYTGVVVPAIWNAIVKST